MICNECSINKKCNGENAEFCNEIMKYIEKEDQAEEEKVKE